MSTNPEIELALLSLTGRRYSEAEEKFTRLLSTPDAPQAWLGLGLAKIGKLPSRKCTPDEVAFCFKKVFTLAPEMQDEACQLALSAAKATLEEVAAMLPEVVAAEVAAKRAAVSGLLHKGFAFLRASGTTSSGSGPTLFTNLDALHDSYRGSVLMDASSGLKANTQQMRSYLAGAVTNIRGAIFQVVPEGFPSRQECIAASDELIQQLSMSVEELRVKSLPSATPEHYRQRYRSSDQKTFFGVCGGLAHRWGWKHGHVQLLFIAMVLAPVVVGPKSPTLFAVSALLLYISPIWYLIELSKAKVKLPTKGVPRPSKA